MRKKTVEEIHQFWDRASSASVDSDGLRPTARDPYLQSVVETTVERYLPKGTVFDIGCGDGLSTIRFAGSSHRIVGFDYIQRFVDLAKTNDKLGIAEFSFADVTDLAPVHQKYGQADAVVTIRCLINLPTWELQKRGIAQIASLVKPGGLYLLSEGWEEGWEALNNMRTKIGLPSIEVVEYNRLLNRTDFEAYVSQWFAIERFDTVGFYIFMSRVFQGALVAPRSPSHTHEINRVASEIQNLGLNQGFENIDYAGVYVLRKK